MYHHSSCPIPEFWEHCCWHFWLWFPGLRPTKSWEPSSHGRKFGKIQNQKIISLNSFLDNFRAHFLGLTDAMPHPPHVAASASHVPGAASCCTWIAIRYDAGPPSGIYTTCPLSTVYQMIQTYLNGCYFIKTLSVIGFCSFCLHATPITRKALLLALRGAGRRLELRLKEIARAVEGGEVGAKVRAFRGAGRMAEVRWESQLGRTSDLRKNAGQWGSSSHKKWQKKWKYTKMKPSAINQPFVRGVISPRYFDLNPSSFPTEARELGCGGLGEGPSTKSSAALSSERCKIPSCKA